MPAAKDLGADMQKTGTDEDFAMRKVFAWIRRSCFRRAAVREWVLFNCRFASYSGEFRERVEDLSASNPYPFSRWFGGKNKVFIPFGPPQPGPGQQQSSDSDSSVREILEENGYQVVDYRGGYCQKGNRKQRIGKVLQSLKKNALDEIRQRHQGGEIYNLERELAETSNYFDGVLSEFLNSPLRAQKKAGGMEVVISQDPHDVATMSTGRSWVSCMELGVGSHHRDVFCEVANGGLVAYLIRAGDQEIRDPLARIHIRRFDNKQGQSVAIPEESIYGNEVSGFQETVKQWLDAMQPDIRPGVYKRMGGEYSDTFGDETIVGPKRVEDVMRWFRGEAEDAKYSKWIVTDEMYQELLEYDMYAGETPVDNLSREFNTREEAEQWAAGNDTDYDREMVSDEWTEFDEEEGEWARPRFDVREKTTDNRLSMKKSAAEEILNAEPGTYPDEVIDEVKAFVFESASDLSRHFVRKYPEKITEEDFKELNDRDSMEFVKALPKEKKGPYLQSWLGHINSSLDDPGSFVDRRTREDLDDVARMEAAGEGTKEPIPGRSVIDGKKTGILSHVSVNINDHVLTPLTEMFSPIPEGVSRKLVDLFENLSERTGAPYDEYGEHEDREMAGLVHAFSMTDTDTPTVQKFYKDILPRWQDRIPGDMWGRPGPINVDTMGYALATLGGNGRDFLPFLNQKMEEEKDYLSYLEENTKGQFIQEIENRKEKSKRNIEKYLYAIDSIESGKGRSSKYRFH